MTRLDFVLPEFFRYMWTSDRARSEWEPRIGAVALAIAELQWLTVANDMRQGGIARVNPEQLQAKRPNFAKRGVEAITVGREARGTGGYQCAARSYVPGKPFQYCVAFGKRGAARELVDSVRSGNARATGGLLGYPECCVSFFLDNCQGHAYRDSVWPMARASVNESQGTEDRSNTIRIGQSSLANVLLRGLGVRAVFHLPCRFDCQESLRFAERTIAIGREEGFAKEMDWLCEMLRWPMEWNALHGIAEIKTPVLKCSTSTDATGTLYRVLVAGDLFPGECVRSAPNSVIRVEAIAPAGTNGDRSPR
jgi:hypothetical protein